jgi:hypothetical protein
MKLEYNGDDEDGGGGGGLQHFATNDNNSYTNMNDENSGDEMNATSNGSIANLKRKRLCDIAYTAEITFESQQAATTYVDSLCLWKFERNRATKKGSKGFYHCKMAENCKSKIYLLSDPFSPKVVLYQNNIEHEHDPNAPPSTAYLDVSSSSTHMAKRSRSNHTTISNNNKSDLNNTHVDIVNENDFEDSFVDFFDNENGEYQQENGWPEDECENENENAEFTNGNLNGGLNGLSMNRSSLLNNTFMNYNMEERFDTRIQANDYLETMYPGVWKFERTRPTKTGAKCFYKCKMSKDCKSKCYILSRPNVDECMLYKNNIEHDHTANGGMGVVGGNAVATPMKKINSQIG